MNNETTMPVEVVYPLPRDQHIIHVDVPVNATVEDAIRASKIQDKYPEIDLAVNKTGIYGKVAKLDAVLHPGDRVEIYRPLIADPKEIRKQRAREGKEMRAGDKG
jgi:putative ubiquitin-RnfH superfamily antitoxin RatB of RatAB toxin-antitoxin module